MLVISNWSKMGRKRNSHCTELSDFKFGVVMVFEYQNNLYLQCHWLHVTFSTRHSPPQRGKFTFHGWKTVTPESCWYTLQRVEWLEYSKSLVVH